MDNEEVLRLLAQDSRDVRRSERESDKIFHQAMIDAIESFEIAVTRRKAELIAEDLPAKVLARQKLIEEAAIDEIAGEMIAREVMDS